MVEHGGKTGRGHVGAVHLLWRAEEINAVEFTLRSRQLEVAFEQIFR